MIPTLDITKDVCPMTFVKVKMTLSKMAPSEKLILLLKEAALKNVISSLKSEGHKIIKVVAKPETFLLEIEKDGNVKPIDIP